MNQTAPSAKCVLLAVLALAGGCFHRSGFIPETHRTAIDRGVIEYPAGYKLEVVIENLQSPSAICFDADGNLIVVESGVGDGEPRIRGFRLNLPDPTTRQTRRRGFLGLGNDDHPQREFQIYPLPRLGLPLTDLRTGFRIRGPVGGIVAHDRRVFVSHRDDRGKGIITSFGYDGSHHTVVGELPAEGDFGVTDLAISPSGRLYFGVGAATNSGVVGIDNWQAGWVKQHPLAADRPAFDLKLLGYRFDSDNPAKGWFGSDFSVTAPFQPFGVARQLRIPREPTDRPNAAIYSVSPLGGDLRVEAWGIRYPRGLAFNEFGRLFLTNNGIELRGTRPVANDPDALLRFVPGAWYGWPDFTADFNSVNEPNHQPPPELLLKHGYPENAAVIDHAASRLIPPDPNALLHVSLPAQSGAAQFVFVPSTGPARDFFQPHQGSILLCLAGDRGPWANAGQDHPNPPGYKVVEITESRQIRDFIRNVGSGPASKLPPPLNSGLNRPLDLQFSPDGSLYLLDAGNIQWPNGQPKTHSPGRIYRLSPNPQ